MAAGTLVLDSDEYLDRELVMTTTPTATAAASASLLAALAFAEITSVRPPSVGQQVAAARFGVLDADGHVPRQKERGTGQKSWLIRKSYKTKRSQHIKLID